jgi:uncharacterized protein YodC (DUF2158 family)
LESRYDNLGRGEKLLRLGKVLFMTEAIKAGDLVRLKSGGPKMTVNLVSNAKLGMALVWCEWFNSENESKRGTFALDAVEAAVIA